MSEKAHSYEINIDDKNDFIVDSPFIDLNSEFRLLLHLKHYKNQNRFALEIYKFKREDNITPELSKLRRWISNGRLRFIKTLHGIDKILFKFIQQSDNVHHFIEIKKL